MTSFSGNPEELLAHHILLIQIHEIEGFRFVGQTKLFYQKNTISKEVTGDLDGKSEDLFAHHAHSIINP